MPSKEGSHLPGIGRQCWGRAWPITAEHQADSKEADLQRIAVKVAQMAAKRVRGRGSDIVAGIGGV